MKLHAMSILALVHSLMLSAGEKPAEVKPPKLDPVGVKTAVTAENGVLPADLLEKVRLCAEEGRKQYQLHSDTAKTWADVLWAAEKRLMASPEEWDDKEFDARISQAAKILLAYSAQSPMTFDRTNKACAVYIGAAKDKAQFARRCNSIGTYLSAFKYSAATVRSEIVMKGIGKYFEGHPDINDDKAKLQFINDVLPAVKYKEELIKYKQVGLGEPDKTKKK